MDEDRRGLRAAALGLLPAAFLVLFFAVPLWAIARHAGGDGFGAARRVLPFTLFQAALSTLVTLAVGMPAAFVLGRCELPARRTLTAIVTAPFVLPTLVVSASLLAIGLRPSLGAILIAHTVFNVAVVVRVVGGVWAEVDLRLVEAARTLGAAPWRAGLLVTLPLLLPSIGAASVIVFLFSFTSFGVIRILGGPAQRTLETEIYRQTADLLRLDRAATLALIQLVLVGGLLVLSEWFSKRNTHTQRRLATEQRVPARPFVAFACVSPSVALALAPLLVLLERSLRDPSGGHSLRNWRALRHVTRGNGLVDAPLASVGASLRIAVAAALIAAVLGALAALALSSAAGRTRFSGLLELGLMLPLGTSAVTLGFGFLVADPLGLRARWWGIPIVHALIGMPFVLRSVLPTLRSIDPHVREAGATLGASPWRSLLVIDLAIVRRGFIAGVGMAFAVSLGEFGAATFLARPSTATLPIAIGRLLGRPGALNVGQAYALSVVLAVLTGGTMMVLERWRPTGNRSVDL